MQPSWYFRSVFFILFLLCLFISASDAALLQFKNVARTLLPMDSVSDYLLKSIFLFFGVLFQYLAISAVFEWTNPIPKSEKRKEEIREEVKLGLGACVVNALFASTWMFFIEPYYTPFYGYYENHPYTVGSFLMGLVIYLFWTDTWFYWTHRLLHIKWFWRNVHYLHHSFLQPTAFAQDAVHPFEALIQGPCGHFIASMLFPMHPIFLAAIGFFTAAYAIAAHDGRSLDLNSHTRHHTHKLGAGTWEIRGVNFGLWWGFWDWVCGTRYDEKACVAWNPVKDAETLQLKGSHGSKHVE